MIWVASSYIYFILNIDWWKFVFSLAFFFDFACFCFFRLLFPVVRRKRDKRDNIAKEFLRLPQMAKWNFSVLRRKKKCCVSSTLAFCFSLEKFAFRVLFLKCAKTQYMNAFSHENDIHFKYMISRRDARERSQTNNQTRFKFVFRYHSMNINKKHNHFEMLLKRRWRRWWRGKWDEINNNRQQKLKWSSMKRRASITRYFITDATWNSTILDPSCSFLSKT